MMYDLRFAGGVYLINGIPAAKAFAQSYYETKIREALDE